MNTHNMFYGEIRRGDRNIILKGERIVKGDQESSRYEHTTEGYYSQSGQRHRPPDSRRTRNGNNRSSSNQVRHSQRPNARLPDRLDGHQSDWHSDRHSDHYSEREGGRYVDSREIR